MNCNACKPLLGEYIDGELSGAEREAVEGHIRRCDACRRQVAFLERLAGTAARLRKDIQPGKDLWPGIEAEIRARPRPESSEQSDDMEPKERRRKTSALWWSLAAAAMFGLLVLAGTYLVSTKRPSGDSSVEGTSITPGERIPDSTESTLGRLKDTRRSTGADRVPGTIENLIVRDFTSQPLEPLSRVFVSNFGIYTVNQDLDPVSAEVRRILIRNFIQNGEPPWSPPLPSGSMLISVYPGEGNSLWVSSVIRKPQFQCEIAELDFGVDSQISPLWQSDSLHIARFVMSPNGWIYATGFPNDYAKTVSKLPRGQSTTTELLHIIDPQTGEISSFWPITLYPDFDSPTRSGQTVLEMTSLANNTVIAVKSNGNFFVTTDLVSTLPQLRGLIKNEAIEYYPNSEMARKWNLGRLEPDAHLNKIFVDVDDSILAEIIRYPDMGGSELLDQALMERYLLRVEPGGRVTSYKANFYPGESIQGWIGDIQELVTTINEVKTSRISMYKLPF